MKTIILLIFSLVILSGCSKNVAVPEAENETKNGQVTSAKDAKAFATIRYTGSFEDGGFGWVLQMTDQVFEVPINLEKDFMVEGMDVYVVYGYTDKEVHCKCREPRWYVEIVDIQKASRYGEGNE
ncbi:membrane lipoprotein lipid attachment site-containing protein [Aridibaculum aurantiacum]|uniref:membrane lipoprotein lipid attachment site-containing protein n=1 Tax=Aridibaculum aurantiacum TaxID=2810307 RepID=UPI001A960BF9|nr:membrane lipoprotein lipid attachment site-containing protein [Aridibaculum aurantiacum]